MKGRAPRPSQVKSFNYKHVKHTNEEVSTMKMKIEQKWREEIELQDNWYFPKSKFFYGGFWYIFYDVDQSSMVIYSYFIKLHQSTPGSLIQEPSFFQKQSIQEQSQPLGRHQSHIQAVSYQEKWIPSDPEKSLSIREQSYPIQERSFRIAENRFQHTVQPNQHEAAMMQLIHQSPKIQYIPEQGQPLGRQQSHIQAVQSHRVKWRFYSEKWWIFFPHYSHPPYRAAITTNKQESQRNRACSPREVFWVVR